MRWLSLVLVLALGAAWSADGAKPQTYSGAQNTKSEQRGTEKSPVFVKGDVTTKKNEQEANDDAKDRKEKAAIDKALIEYTRLAAIFTFMLFFAAATGVRPRSDTGQAIPPAHAPAPPGRAGRCVGTLASSVPDLPASEPPEAPQPGRYRTLPR